MLTPLLRTMLGRGLGSLYNFIKYLFNEGILPFNWIYLQGLLILTKEFSTSVISYIISLAV